MLDIFIDTETTGLRPEYCGVIAVGLAWRAKEGGEIQTWSADANPGEGYLKRPGVDEAFAVNGFTKERVRQAAPAEKVGKRLRDQIREVGNVGEGVRLLAYNSQFDYQMLERWPWLLRDFFWGPCVMEGAKYALDIDTFHYSLLDSFQQVVPQPEGADLLRARAHEVATDCIMTLHVWEFLQRHFNYDG